MLSGLWLVIKGASEMFIGLLKVYSLLLKKHPIYLMTKHPHMAQFQPKVSLVLALRPVGRREVYNG